MIIEVGNEKGGVGKSTLAIHIAHWISKQGHSVVLVDTDSQKTASYWGEARTQNGIAHDFLIVDKSVDPTTHVLKLSENYDVVVVDVGARDYDRMTDLAKIVDLWITPTQSGQSDLESTCNLTWEFEKANRIHKNGLIPQAIVLNRIPAAWNNTEGQVAFEALQEALPSTPTVKNMIRDRKVYRDAHKIGKTIFEMPKAERDKAEAEFDAMMNETLKIYERFKKKGTK